MHIYNFKMVALDINVYTEINYVFRERERVQCVFVSASTVVRDQQREGDIVASERSVE